VAIGRISKVVKQIDPVPMLVTPLGVVDPSGGTATESSLDEDAKFAD
jgi:hypothetical protein